MRGIDTKYRILVELNIEFLFEFEFLI